MLRCLALLLLFASCRQILGIEGGVVGEPPSDSDPGDSNGNGEALGCPSQCTSCNIVNRTCKIDCAQTNCDNQVTCPMGWGCDILCSPPSSCRNGIDCLNATSCIIECSGTSSCRNLACGPGPCLTNCTGTNACSAITCGTSCACDVMCDADASCSNVSCTSPTCDTGLGCSALNPGCSSCQ